MGNKRKAFAVVVRLLPDGAPMKIVGRDGSALHQLYLASIGGCTPLACPGPRWSHYVFKLRRMGIDIETLNEAHGGQFSGHHARYILRSAISLLIADDNQARAA